LGWLGLGIWVKALGYYLFKDWVFREGLKGFHFGARFSLICQFLNFPGKRNYLLWFGNFRIKKGVFQTGIKNFFFKKTLTF